jgi:hypothetical protein
MAKTHAKPKSPAGRKQMPREHPGPWGSVLWDHLDEIRSMRRARKRWLDIETHLRQQHGIRITQRAIRNFFARATDPKQKRPLGWEEPARPAPAPSSPPVPAPEASKRPTARQLNQIIQPDINPFEIQP